MAQTHANAKQTMSGIPSNKLVRFIKRLSSCRSLLLQVNILINLVLIIGAVIFIKYCKGRGKYTSNSSPADADYSKGSLKVENLPQASNEVIS